MSDQPLHALLADLFSRDRPEIVNAFHSIKAALGIPDSPTVVKTDDELRDECRAMTEAWVKSHGDGLNWSQWVLAAAFFIDQGGSDSFMARAVGDQIVVWKEAKERPTNISKTLDLLGAKGFIDVQENEGSHNTYRLTKAGRREALRMIQSNAD